jgi:amino acid adenylation domain-containing protein
MADVDDQPSKHSYWQNRELDLDTSKTLVRLFRNGLEGAGATATAPLEAQVSISGEVAEAFLRISNGADLALFILFATTVKAVIARYTGETLVSFMAPPMRAASEGPGDGDGSCLLIQDRFVPSGDLRANAQVSRRTLIGAYSNQDAFASTMADAGLRKRIEADHVLVTMPSLHRSGHGGPPTLLEIQLRRDGSKLSAAICFDGDLLSASLVEQFGRHLGELLQQSCLDVSRPLGEIELATAEDLDQLDTLARGRATARPTCGLHNLFIAQARLTPDAPALLHDGQELDYAALDALSDRAAQGLVSLGIVSGDFVALLMSRSVAMIVAMLAVNKAGAAFVPISTTEPASRLDRILDQADPRLILSNVAESDLPPGRLVMTVDEVVAHADKVGAIDVKVDLTAPAYAIFTSGSTGTPKGVVVEHRGIVNSIMWWREAHGFSDHDRNLLLFPYNFDGFITGLYAPLTAGAMTVLVKDDEAWSAAALAAKIEEHRITYTSLTPALYQSILEEATSGELSTLTLVTLAGDKVRASTIALSESLNPRLRLSNAYGPTEGSVVATYKPRVTASAPNSIGRPIDNMDVHILDSEMRPAPVGVYGQIALSGVGLARGYLGIDADARFTQWNGRRVYLTGDIARWGPDGEIDFRGRMNDYAKIRGYRVDLEEVRQAILAFPGIKDSVVVMAPVNGDEIFAAAATSVGPFERDDMIAHLRQLLQSYMIPSQILRLHELPLTATGKYDLSRIKSEIASQAVPAGDDGDMTETEGRLAGLWCDVLSLPSVGLSSNFFALGGHSLKATRLLARVRAEFNVDLPLEDILRENTVRRLSAVIDQKKGSGEGVIGKAPPGDRHVLSCAQERMLVLANEETLAGSYNVTILLAVDGTLDVPRLQAALSAVARRHDSLRTAFRYERNRAVQLLDPNCAIVVEHRGLPGATPDEVVRACRRSFDLGQAPLWGVTVVDAEPKGRFLFFEFHHIIVDEASLAIFFKDLVELYDGNALDDPPAATYVDYAVWQRAERNTPVYRQKLDYWRDKLVGARLEPVHLPTARTGDGAKRGAQIPVALGRELSNDIDRFCRTQKVSQFTFFTCALATLLHRTSAQEEIVLATPVSSRSARETEGMVGLFLNTILLHYRLNEAEVFSRFLQSVRRQLIDDLAHADAQLEDVLKGIGAERSSRHGNFFNVMITVLDNELGPLDFDDFSAVPTKHHNGTAKFDLLLEIAAGSDGIELVLEYDEAILDRNAVTALADGLVRLLEAVIRDPQAVIGSLPSPALVAPASTETAAPQPMPDRSHARPPATPLERRLAEAWSEILGVDLSGLGVSDSFFMLGGDSIAANLLAQRIRGWGLSVRLADVFRNDTVSQQALLLENAIPPAAEQPQLSQRTSKGDQEDDRVRRH